MTMLKKDDWLEQGELLAKQHQRNGRWIIGDWLNQILWGSKYATAAPIFDLSRGTLKNYASICKKFDASRRREHLTFEHHVAVAAVDPEEQDKLLDLAESDELSARDLRALAHSDEPTRRLTLEVPEQTIELWEAAAGSAEQLKSWLRRAANAYASQSASCRLDGVSMKS